MVKNHVGFQNVRPVKFRGFDDSTQDSREAVGLEWDLGEKIIRFAAQWFPDTRDCC